RACAARRARTREAACPSRRGRPALSPKASTAERSTGGARDAARVLSEKPTTFTITVTSEAGENDETVQTTLKFTYREKYPDETPLYEIISQENLEDNDVTDIIKLLEQENHRMVIGLEGTSGDHL
uniref:RWD domain-containing protein n=1 Tax=Dromaius novaehollandiae TaxID=8790 RepID=A0A8C4JP27_DRONO